MRALKEVEEAEIETAGVASGSVEAWVAHPMTDVRSPQHESHAEPEGRETATG